MKPCTPGWPPSIPRPLKKLTRAICGGVIRALEVYYKTGIPISRHQQKKAPSYHVQLIGLTRPRRALYDRIDRRIEAMMERGLLAEVKQLAEAGYGWDQPAMSGLGYRQIGQYVRG